MGRIAPPMFALRGREGKRGSAFLAEVLLVTALVPFFTGAILIDLLDLFLSKSEMMEGR